VGDALHGASGSAVLPGASLRQLSALHAFALEQGWRCAVPAALLKDIPPEVALPGRDATLGATPMTELLPGRPLPD